MKDHAFFPMIEIRSKQHDFDNSTHDIFKDEEAHQDLEIDLKKLERYIQTRITVKYVDHRAEKYHNIPFTYC